MIFSIKSISISFYKIFALISLFILTLNPHSDVTITQAQDSWLTLSSGIDYREFHLPDPNHIYVARMDRSNKNVTLESGLGWGQLSNGRETVRDIAKRYENALGYWGENWGARNKVIVAINGYYFDQETGLPWRGQVQSGWYIKRFDNFESGSGIVWKLNGDIFIGGCISHPASKQIISFENGQSQRFNGINKERGKNELIIYTPHYSDTTGTDNQGVEVVVELEMPLSIHHNSNKNYGIIRKINTDQGSTPLSFNTIVLSATGSARDSLENNIQVGQNIGITQQISHYKTDCKTVNENDWSNVYTAIGGDFVFLESGEKNYFEIGSANVRAPRTAIAYNDEFIYFIVVDGRNPGISVGMSMWELAEFSKSYLGADWGIAEDSGGSSTMVVNGKVVNNTFCNFNDCEQFISEDTSQLTSSSGILSSDVSTISELAATYQTITESLVGNAIMMVQVLPPIKSKTFQIGDSMRTVSSTDIHLGPGTNYSSIKSLPLYSKVTITASSSSLNGIFSQGSFWWNVIFDGVDGWISEETLAGGITQPKFSFPPKYHLYRKR